MFITKAKQFNFKHINNIQTVFTSIMYLKIGVEYTKIRHTKRKESGIILYDF